jgi:hypothetical protein
MLIDLKFNIKTAKYSEFIKGEMISNGATIPSPEFYHL